MGLRRAARLLGRHDGKRRKMTSAPGYARGSTWHRAGMSARLPPVLTGPAHRVRHRCRTRRRRCCRLDRPWSDRPRQRACSAGRSCRGRPARASLCRWRTRARHLAFLPCSTYGTRRSDRRCSAGMRVSCIGGPVDRFGGDAMTMTDKTRNVLRATGNVLARALGMDGKANAVRSSWGLTSAAESSDSIMVAGSPGRRVAGSPGRRVAGDREGVLNRLASATGISGIICRAACLRLPVPLPVPFPTTGNVVPLTASVSHLPAALHGAEG